MMNQIHGKMSDILFNPPLAQPLLLSIVYLNHYLG